MRAAKAASCLVRFLSMVGRREGGGGGSACRLGAGGPAAEEVLGSGVGVFGVGGGDGVLACGGGLGEGGRTGVKRQMLQRFSAAVKVILS